MKAARVCSVPGCGVILPRAGKCREHELEAQRRSDAKRPSATERGYNSTEWRRVRARYLAAHPYCEAPWGCLNPASHVDHIHGQGPFGDNSDEALQALCPSCHSKKTVRSDGGFGHAPKEKP